MSNMAGLVGYQAGVPIYRYGTTPETPPVSVVRFHAGVHPQHGQRHIHQFPALMFRERGIDIDCDLYVVATGAVIDPTVLGHDASGYGVFFDPMALGADGQVPWSSWRTHPLLFPFLHGNPDGLLQLRVPPQRSAVWRAGIAAIEAELASQQEGFRQAVVAHLTLLLVDVARLAEDVVGDLRRNDEPLLADVFEIIEQRFADPISLREVAQAVGMTSGYLTTLVRRRTGRTVVDWLTERRMTEARRLLAETDMPVNDIARRVGLPDPGYFTRVFRRDTGIPPRDWRRRNAAAR